MTIYYAHSLEDRLPSEWEPLEVHLRLVADGDNRIPGAAGLAKAFGAAEWGRILGLWHDLGKYSKAFQAYILGAHGLDASLETLPGNNKVDHSAAGAQHAVQQFGAQIGGLLAYCIAGHHGGLPNAEPASGVATCLRSRLVKDIPSYDESPQTILQLPQPPSPPLQLLTQDPDQSFQLSVFCRMLFSCLVDADFLATESFMSPDKAKARPDQQPSPARLSSILDMHLNRLQASANDSEVNRQRRSVLDACRRAAEMKPGIFSLTVPTGGGKTLSSMAFALKHAAQHDLRRVIYAIPFTSIIEQNAKVFREALADAGPDVILEHHCNLNPEKETRTGRLATENWDAPIVVTTNVQFFESLFSNRTSRCRKLHRIARSVIVLDEVQTIPVDLLRPTLLMLAELARNYGCTVVLCSATQPAITRRNDFAIGLQDVHEIIDDVPQLFDCLKRVELEQLGALEDEALIEELARDDNHRVLCVVNTRAHAARLFDALRQREDQNVFHLSAQMCPAHRSDVLSEIRSQLERGNDEPCRVISTQLVEAGVDIDFPVVYRAMAGLDSIMQAAGRCNREGKLERGYVRLFKLEKGTFPEARRAAQETDEVARMYDDLTSLEAVESFFKLHYWQHKNEWDKHEIMRLFSQTARGLKAQFGEVADRYKLIRNEQTGVIVPYDEKAKSLIAKLRAIDTPDESEPEWKLRRKLQPYTVSVRDNQLHQLCENAVLEPLHERYWIVGNDDAYDSELGLRLDVFGMSIDRLVH